MQDSKIFRDYVSPKRLLNVVKEVSNYHRIQASPMFREAAEHVLKICKGYGLDAELLDFESTPETWYTRSSFVPPSLKMPASSPVPRHPLS